MICRQTLRQALRSLACVVLLIMSRPALAANPDYVWKSVAISGAQALVAGVVTHPSGLVCIRTDVGGAYRWDRPNSRWIALNDSFAFTNRDCFGCRFSGTLSVNRPLGWSGRIEPE